MTWTVCWWFHLPSREYLDQSGAEASASFPTMWCARPMGVPGTATIRELLPHADHAAENVEMEHQEIEDIDGVVPLPERCNFCELCLWTAGPSSRRVPGRSPRCAVAPRDFRCRNNCHFDDVLKGKPDPGP